MKIGHQSHNTVESNEKYTPAYVFEKLNCRFDLDVCAPAAHTPSKDWCREYYSLEEGRDGLALPWHGLIWMNMPWQRGAKEPWVEKAANYLNGVALVPFYMEAKWFHDLKAEYILIPDHRIRYIDGSGETIKTKAGGTSSFPSVFVGWGDGVDVLEYSGWGIGLRVDRWPIYSGWENLKEELDL